MCYYKGKLKCVRKCEKKVEMKFYKAGDVSDYFCA